MGREGEGERGRKRETRRQTSSFKSKISPSPSPSISPSLPPPFNVSHRAVSSPPWPPPRWKKQWSPRQYLRLP